MRLAEITEHQSLLVHLIQQQLDKGAIIMVNVKGKFTAYKGMLQSIHRTQEQMVHGNAVEPYLKLRIHGGRRADKMQTMLAADSTFDDNYELKRIYNQAQGRDEFTLVSRKSLEESVSEPLIVSVARKRLEDGQQVYIRFGLLRYMLMRVRDVPPTGVSPWHQWQLDFQAKGVGPTYRMISEHNADKWRIFKHTEPDGSTGWEMVQDRS